MRAAVVDDVLRCDDVFACAAELGVAGVEVNLRRDARPPRATLPVPSVILGEHNRVGGVADADPAVAAAARADVERAIGSALELGADVVLVPFFLAADLHDADAVGRCADAFAELCPLAERAGVSLCFEGSLGSGDLLALAERVGSPAFGCYFDPANIVVAGFDPPSEARALAPLIRRVHLKDTREKRGDCRPGEGRVDFRGCAEALADIGYDGWVVLETPPGPPDEVARDLAFARSVFPTLTG